MSRKTLLMATVVLLLAGAWLCTRLWSEPAESTDRPADTDVRQPPPGKGPLPDEVSQWLRQMGPGQKRAVLRALLAALREDLMEGHRRAAEERFHQADTDDDGMLTFEEAWKTGVFRVGRGGAEGKGTPDADRGLRERVRERSRLGVGPRESGAPSERRSQAAEPHFPVSEIEQELLESWELLQELNVLAQDAGDR